MRLDLDRVAPVMLYVGPQEQMHVPRDVADVVEFGEMLGRLPWERIAVATPLVRLSLKDTSLLITFSVETDSLLDWPGFALKDRVEVFSLVAVQRVEGVVTGTAMTVRFSGATIAQSVHPGSTSTNTGWRGTLSFEVERARQLQVCEAP